MAVLDIKIDEMDDILNKKRESVRRCLGYIVYAM